jgi:ABC-type protease/lipase transport system fused ATPase/permease subunit
MFSLFAAMLLFSGLDVFYSVKAYDETRAVLIKANLSIEANEENLNNPETVSLVDEANRRWERNKKRLMMLTNHNVIRYTDEKFVALTEQVRGNNADDATVTVKILISYMKDLKDESFPLLRNII